MDTATKQKVDKILELRAKSRQAMAAGNEGVAAGFAREAGVIRKQAVEEPEYVVSSEKEIIEKAGMDGLGIIQKSCREDTGYGKQKVDVSQQAFQDWNDQVLLGIKWLRIQLKKQEINPEAAHPDMFKSEYMRNLWNDGKKRFSRFIDVEKKATEIRKANAIYTGGTGYGAEWIPTGWSRELIDVMHLAMRVPAAFKSFPMPNKTYDWPAFTGDLHFLIGSEVSTTSPSLVGAVDAATGKITFTAKKLEGRVTMSGEEEEDAIVPSVIEFKGKFAKAYPMDLEDIIINGDDATTHMDSDVTTSTDRRKLLDGLRLHEVTTTADVDLGTLTTAKVLSMRVLLDVGFREKSQGLYIGSTKACTLVGGLTEFVSVEKYGPNAFVLTGEVGKIGGVSVIESEKVRENLNATGFYDGTTTTKTILLYACTEAFRLGNYKGLVITVVYEPTYDCIYIVARVRLDFKAIYATTNKMVSLGYNMA